MTETSPALTMLLKEDHLLDGTPEQLRRLNSCGKQVLGVEVRVVNAAGEDVQPREIGEIIARGPNVMLGYWRMPEVTAGVLKDGWMHTGDLATVDEEQYIYISSKNGRNLVWLRSSARKGDHERDKSALHCTGI